MEDLKRDETFMAENQELPLDETPETPSEAAADTAPLETELAEARAERDQFRELAARAQAEGINYRNWAEREFKRLKSQGAERAVMALLPVLDNLERALSVDGDEKSLRQGLRMVRDQFLSSLTDLGAAILNPVDQPFSPLEHHAVGLVSTEDPSADGRVCEVFQKGCSLNGVVIRPAQVRVARYEAPETGEAPPEQP